MTIVQATMFDYAELDTETRIVVQQRTSEIKALMKRAASDIIEIGQKLIEVKARLGDTLGYGYFGKWLDAEFDWSADTAERFMSVARRFGNFPQIAESFAPSALYLLAARSTPEAARAEAIARAEEGEDITHATARSIVHDHKHPAAPYVPFDAEEDDSLFVPIELPPDAPAVLRKALADYYANEAAEYDHPDIDRFDPQVHIAFNTMGEPIDLDGMTDAQYHNAHYLEGLATDAGLTIDVKPISDPHAAQRQQRMQATVYSSESNEWYTPAWVTARAADVLGNIDLDPASSQVAQRIHGADAWHGLDHPNEDRRDGLSADWHGNVWLNPPYGRSEDGHNAQLWSRKLIDEWKAGRVTSGILLVKAALGYNWFEDLWRELPVCFLRERLSFVRPDGTDDGQSKQATALFYVGNDIEQFAGVFAKYGRVVLPESDT